MMDKIVTVYEDGERIGCSFYKDVKAQLESHYQWVGGWYWDDESVPPLETRLYQCPETGYILPLWLVITTQDKDEES